jgi:5-methylcytosine-specific restriction endonuclease McrA
MGKKDDKKWRRQRREKRFWHEMGEGTIAHEKNKARSLRQSSWWKKKIAKGECYYCGKTFSPDELTMDHVIPLSRGGSSEKINLVPCCKECNNKKKYLLPTEWEEYLQTIKKADSDR